MRERSAVASDFDFESSIPIVRVLDEATAKKFYVDFLGFAVD